MYSRTAHAIAIATCIQLAEEQHIYNYNYSSCSTAASTARAQQDSRTAAQQLLTAGHMLRRTCICPRPDPDADCRTEERQQ